MIDNMLDFSRIEAGKKQYELREASLQEIVRAFVDQYSAHIKQSGFTLDVRIAPHLPRLRLDREAIKLVLVNLVQNALKYSGPEKYIGITVEGRGQSVVIEIRDKGIGIADGERQRIFEKFGRADDPRVQASEGSGLGLFLVRHAVRAHGGSIDVQSRLAEGTTFSIYLPIGQPQRGKME
jgi:signal transduction histidine kinase